MHSLFKIILLPFSLLYRIITSTRNFLYNKRIFKYTRFDIPVIGVGNLSVGGTGKTPMVEYLIELLSKKYTIATLSRGYGRNTKGFRIAGEKDDAKTIGDEPHLLYTKYGKDVIVSVGEERILAVPQLLYTNPEIQIIILDDAFQHRSINLGFQILLTEFSNPFYNDRVLPAGRLRESRAGAVRADAVVVTKCPTSITLDDIAETEENIRKYAGDKPVFFSTLAYGEPYPISEENITYLEDVVLVTGIANATPVINEVSDKFNLIKHYEFPDHHEYKRKDLVKISNFIKREHPQAIILTTEKDAVKIKPLLDKLSPPTYALPVKMTFLKNEQVFTNLVRQSAVYKEDS